MKRAKIWCKRRRNSAVLLTARSPLHGPSSTTGPPRRGETEGVASSRGGWWFGAKRGECEIETPETETINGGTASAVKWMKGAGRPCARGEGEGGGRQRGAGGEGRTMPL
ncbi:hypothetical protein KM043_016370 [Ampulex compressa]|nr:hypothetical protein KM043_016370 [Ampulex compressa]